MILRSPIAGVAAHVGGGYTTCWSVRRTTWETSLERMVAPAARIRLKLVALDEDDLAVMSAHLQDAVLKVGDIAWLPRERRFALVANRFDWAPRRRAQNRRRSTGLHFDRVTRVRRPRFGSDEPDAVLNLLAVTFEDAEAPSGFVTLVFSGGAAVRLEVECLECEMSDLGPVWETSSLPRHDTSRMIRVDSDGRHARPIDQNRTTDPCRCGSTPRSPISSTASPACSP